MKEDGIRDFVTGLLQKKDEDAVKEDNRLLYFLSTFKVHGDGLRDKS